MRRVSVSLCVLVFFSAVLCAVDLGHSTIAALTRFGFINGPYLTYNHATVIPELLAGLILGAIATVVLLAGALASGAGCGAAEYLLHSASRVVRVRFLPLATLIFASQLVLLAGMESIEQIAAFGHPLGVAAMLGAPAFVALTLHALAAVIIAVFALLASRSIAAAAWTCARTLGPKIRRLLVSAFSSHIARRPLADRHERKHVKPLAARIANRPPPFAVSAA